ncbi:MAG: hypothetical protein P8Y67_10845 [Alphaproteobacteria bacterium]
MESARRRGSPPQSEGDFWSWGYKGTGDFRHEPPFPPSAHDSLSNRQADSCRSGFRSDERQMLSISQLHVVYQQKSHSLNLNLLGLIFSPPSPLLR